ncbi:MAG: hypothetical protein E7391_00135 [Ruminococcaceae bacterium]|nr:hypothetical protein [Oscillospiraceae bacterium]
MTRIFTNIAKLLCILLLLGIIFIRYYPIKMAKDMNNIQSEYECIVCSAAYTTGFEWLVEQSSNSYKGYIFIEGVMENPHKSIKYDVLPENKFILYGNYDGERYFDGKYYPVFKAKKWDVVYPVKRSDALPCFLSPSFGLTWIDLLH